MMYLWPTSSSLAGFHPLFGVMRSPSGGMSIGVREGRLWACDNEAFTQGFNPDTFFRYIERMQLYRSTLLFLVVPDVVGDALATLDLWVTWADQIRPYGPVAFVAQDGQEHLPLPADFDWLFVGGSTEWKMSADADECIQRAQAMGKRIHIGRVNSLTRYRHFHLLGADSCDGTYPRFNPAEGQQRLTKALSQPKLLEDLCFT